MDPNLKQRIIEEAYRLFITKGMKQTSFCDVAVAVHKSKGAVIHYFPSKKKLIDAVVRMRFFRLSGNFWLVSFKISYLCLPLFHETRTTPSCHPSGCAYRQL